MKSNEDSHISEKIVLACVKFGWEPWKGKSNWVSLADVMGEDSPEKLRSQYRRLRDRIEESGQSIEDYIKELGEKSVIFSRRVDEEKEKQTAFDSLVGASGIDIDLFEVEKGSFWGSTSNINASFKFKRRDIPREDQIDALLERLEGRTPSLFVTPKSVSGEYLAIASIYDLHLGRAEITGKGLPDIRDRMLTALSGFGKALSRFDGELTKILFVIGNDFSNYDNTEGTTTRGTPQENSTHWRIGVDVQCELAVYAVDYLSKYAPVEVKIVPGNHDMYSNYWLGKYMKAWYRDAKHVKVDNSKSTRKFFKFGNNAFMFLHGNEVRRTNMIPVFAVEGSHVFPEATYREIHTGHFHGRRETVELITEEYGVITKIHPSLSDSNDWEALKAYTLNNKAGIVSFYHKENGLESDTYVKVD